MKINFPIPLDNQKHLYCINCHAEKITQIIENGITKFKCSSCKTVQERRIEFYPKLVYWIDEDTKELWHESVGAFIFNSLDQILLFERTIFPYFYTVPAGHLERGESPDMAIMREISEEVGLNPSRVELFDTSNIWGNQCSRGADIHKWNLFVAKIPNEVLVIVNEEGNKPVWLSLDEALQKDNLDIPVRYFIQKHGEQLYKGL